MRKRTLIQNRMFHALVNDGGIDSDRKADLVHAFTNGRAESSADMTEYEMDRLIKYLRGESHERFAYFDSENKQHRTVLSLAIRCGWTRLDKENKEVADLKILGSWIANYGVVKKPLNQYKPADLSRLIYQLEQLA